MHTVTYTGGLQSIEVVVDFGLMSFEYDVPQEVDLDIAKALFETGLFNVEPDLPKPKPKPEPKPKPRTRIKKEN